MLSESISGTLMMTSLIRSLAAIASEKYFKLDKPEPNDLPPTAIAAPTANTVPPLAPWYITNLLPYQHKNDHTAKTTPLLPIATPLAIPCFNPNLTVPSKAAEYSNKVLFSPTKE
ncbi:hypothetical protein HanXRQr2_Chr14g0653141 [Helianthus annuus]|uniref:Uncharacterized protein n=1 Tax=Helianthus annuus TaxID=4232 RepID=A0A9K3EB03_HELAN|nr:hypothetical protein HanXRQr2_Chr14g0653141 [Helianthus annuus]